MHNITGDSGGILPFSDLPRLTQQNERLQQLFDSIYARALERLRQLRRRDHAGVRRQRVAHGSGLFSEVGRERRLRLTPCDGLRRLRAFNVE